MKAIRTFEVRMKLAAVKVWSMENLCGIRASENACIYPSHIM